MNYVYLQSRSGTKPQIILRLSLNFSLPAYRGYISPYPFFFLGATSFPSSPSFANTSSNHVTLLQRLDALVLARRKRARQVVLRGNTLNTVRRVDVLDHGDLVAGRRPLSRDDGAVGEEVFPYLCPRVLACSSLQIREGEEMEERLTLNHFLPYLASTFSLFAIQFLYHLHSVAE